MIENTYTERRKFIIRQVAQIAGIGFAYFVFSSTTGVYIPCPIKLIFGYKCPGCGVTHYALAMLHGNLPGAYDANRLLFFLIPLLVLYGVYRAILYVRVGKRGFTTIESVLLSIVFLVTIGFGVFRNIFNI